MNAITAARLGRGATIRLRLAITFSVLILLLAGTAAIGAWRLAQLSAITDDLATVHLRMERLVGEWLSHTRSNAVRATVLTHSEDPELTRLLMPTMEATSRRISTLQKELEGLLDTPEAKKLFDEVGTRRAAYLASRKAVLELKKAGDSEGALRMMEGTMLPAIDRYVGSIQAMSEHFSSEVGREANKAAAAAATGRNLVLGLAAGGILLALFDLTCRRVRSRQEVMDPT